MRLGLVGALAALAVVSFSAPLSAQQCNITATTCSGAVSQCRVLVKQYGYNNVNCSSIGARCIKSGGNWKTRACNLKLKPV